MFNYFYDYENEQYLFLQMPLMLIEDDQFKNLSDGAKILYSLLLRRTALSSKNGWKDSEGRVYIIFTIEEVMEKLNCWENKATKTMKELKKIGLIKSVRQGLGKPNLIYVMNFSTPLKYKPENKKDHKITENPVNKQDCKKNDTITAEKAIPEFVEKAIPELSKSQCSDRDLREINNSDIEVKSESESKPMSEERYQKLKFEIDDMPVNDTTTNSCVTTKQQEKMDTKKELSQAATPTKANGKESTYTNDKDYNTYFEIIQENIRYDDIILEHPESSKLIDEIIECMLDVICTPGETVRIAGENKNRNIVINQYLKLGYEEITHIMYRYEHQNHRIRHIANYIKTMLYNVRQEFEHFYGNILHINYPKSLGYLS